MSEEKGSRDGWVRPQRKRTAAELRELIGQRRGELAALEAELQELVDDARLEALVAVRNLMRWNQISISDLDLEPGRRSRVRKTTPRSAGSPDGAAAA